MKLDRIGQDSMSIIFSYLHFKDAVNVCFLNKMYYDNFLIFCYKFSFVSLNLNKQEYRHNVKFEVLDKITYANCISNINSLQKISKFVPKYLLHVSLGKNFNTPWDKKIWPDTVQTITFHKKSKFNYNISALNLPCKLKKITFGYAFDKSIDDLPDTVEGIFFCQNSRFNQLIRKYPAKMQEIHFGDYYNKSIDKMAQQTGVIILYFSARSIFKLNIPQLTSLEQLYLGKWYNKPIDDILENCTKLKTLKFHKDSLFDQPIHVGSYSLENLTFGTKFNNYVNFAEFTALISLRFYIKSSFDQDLDNLPPNLVFLYLNKRFHGTLKLKQTSLQLVKFPANSRFRGIITIHHEFQGDLIRGRLY